MWSTSSKVQNVPKKGGLVNAAVFAVLPVDVEFRIFITYSLENWDPYVHAKHRNISEWYQGAEKLIFKISNTCKIPVVFQYYMGLQVPSQQQNSCCVNTLGKA